MGNFVIVPDEFHQLGLTPNEKLILAMVYTYSQRDQGCCYSTMEETARRFGTSTKTVQRSYETLLQMNLVERVKVIVEGEQRTGYTFVDKMSTIRQNVQDKMSSSTDKMSTNNIDNNIYKHSTTRTREDFDFYGFFKDLGADDQSLKDWKEVRRKKGGINTKSAADAILKEINKSGKSVRECIAKSASSSWCGFKWSWWLREIDEESGNNMRRNEGRNPSDRRRGLTPSHPATAEEWGFGDRQKKK